MSEGEISGVHSTVNRHTKFLDYPAFRSVLQEHDFDLRELKRQPGGVMEVRNVVDRW
jgi:type IV secretion system protein VirD4